MPSTRKYVNYKLGAVGTRSQVWCKNAHHTSGGLTKNDLKRNKQGKIVSKKASASAKKSNNLTKNGYYPLKGEFGYYDENTDKEVRPKRKRSNSSKRKCRDPHQGHTHYRSGPGGKPHRHRA